MTKFLRAALLAIFAQLFCCATFATITIESVPVGDLGNPNDPATGNIFGGVNHEYFIGTYETTVGEYTAFLNAVAATDTYGLYNSKMATDLNVAGIAQNGSPGSYSYSVIGSARHPITYVSWGDAARFANWMQNGQPTGPQNVSTTEHGAYTLNGATTDSALLLVTRNPGAKWFIPTASEWYKAAYYQPTAKGGDSDGYWNYATRTNATLHSDQPPGFDAPDTSNVANFEISDFVSNGFDDGYAVTGTTVKSSSQNYLTDVGAYSFSRSYYRTYDQTGNVWEWNEDGGTTSRRYAGGYWGSSVTGASTVLTAPPSSESPGTGFRIASIAAAYGDFNDDAVVDAADYVVWRNNNLSMDDYNTWRAHFGQYLVVGGAGSGSAVTIPEPSAFAIVVFSIAITVGLGRRPNSRNDAWRAPTLALTHHMPRRMHSRAEGWPERPN